MLAQASFDLPRKITLQQARGSGIFVGKKCRVVVHEPKVVTEAGFLSSSHFLEFTVSVSGEVATTVNRRDQEFSELHSYLTLHYPNVLVPCLEKF